MTRFLRRLRGIIRPSVTVNISKRKVTDFDRLKAEKCRQLAAECGMEWPVDLASKLFPDERKPGDRAADRDRLRETW